MSNQSARGSVRKSLSHLSPSSQRTLGGPHHSRVRARELEAVRIDTGCLLIENSPLIRWASPYARDLRHYGGASSEPYRQNGPSDNASVCNIKILDASGKIMYVEAHVTKERYHHVRLQDVRAFDYRRQALLSLVASRGAVPRKGTPHTTIISTSPTVAGSIMCRIGIPGLRGVRAHSAPPGSPRDHRDCRLANVHGKRLRAIEFLGEHRCQSWGTFEAWQLRTAGIHREPTWQQTAAQHLLPHVNDEELLQGIEILAQTHLCRRELRLDFLPDFLQFLG